MASRSPKRGSPARSEPAGGHSLRDRFLGNRSLLVQALLTQKVVAGHPATASALARRTELIEFARGDTLIRQGASDNSLLFLLSGSVAVIVNGREVGIRAPGEHVGEMALLDPGARRAATIVATEPTLVASIGEPDLARIANARPVIWRAMAVELSRRLRQRSQFLAEPNARPVVFIGSSRESLPYATAVESHLRRARVIVRLWTKGVFGPSRFTIEDLEAQVRTADFAVLVAAGDDRVLSKGAHSGAPRDNVVFELGLFIGALSRHRTFLLVPRGRNIKIPTDLLGMTPLVYDPTPRTPHRATRGACRELRKTIENVGAK